MKLEIELDLNKIDYDAINKQIHDKIETLNIADAYAINSKIRDKVNEEVSNRVQQVMDRGPWSYGVNENIKGEISKEIHNVAESLIKPRVETLLSTVSQEEFDKMVMDIYPKVLIEIMSDHIQGMLQKMYRKAHENIIIDARNQFNAMIHK